MADDVQTYLNRAHEAYQNRSFTDAESLYQRALDLQPGNARALHSLGVLRDRLQDSHKAEDYYRAALAADPCLDITRRALASLLFDTGKHTESQKLYAQLIARDPHDADAHFAYSRLATYVPSDSTLAALKAAAADMRRHRAPDQVKLFFAIGKAHQDLGEFDSAFNAFKCGNDLHYARHPYNEAANYAMLDDLTRCLNPDFMSTTAPLDSDDCLPIFVLGMPRSGSTLVEQILASHSDVATAGETKYLKQSIQRHLIADRGTFSNAVPGWSRQALENAANEYRACLRRHAGGATYVIDKMPGNFAFVGIIKLLFPTSHIVHTVRHPMATIWSNYSTHFGDALYYTYRLDVLTRYFKKYRAMMNHWKESPAGELMLDVAYERLVGETEPAIRELLDFLDLAWEPACLEFYKAQRSVRTASVAQVRKPLYASSLDIWRNYSAQLGTCKQLLDQP